MSDPYLGQIMLTAISFAPRGWHACDGSILSVNQYTALFSLLGTTFGGNGQTTFGLPDLRSRLPICAGTGAGLTTYALGQVGGAQSVTLTSSNIGPHTHPAVMQVTAAPGRGGTTAPPTAGYVLQTTTTVDPASSPTLVPLSGVTIQPNAGGSPFSILPPFLALNYYIALTGIYPTRS